MWVEKYECKKIEVFLSLLISDEKKRSDKKLYVRLNSMIE